MKLARIVMLHAALGYKIHPVEEQDKLVAEGWQPTKITPEEQEAAEAHSKAVNDGDQDERQERQLADEIDAAGGPEAHAKLMEKRKAKAKPAAGDGDKPKDPPGDAPKAKGKAKAKPAK